MPPRSFLRCLTVLATVLLAACSDGDSSSSMDSTDPSFTVSGVAANGPLDGATVEVFSPEGNSLGSTETDAQGNFSLEIDQAPPYRLTTQGGQYNGQAYSGSFTAWCEAGAAEGQVQCELTPLSSVVATLMDRGYNLGESEALLEQRYGSLDDPFTRELRTGETVPVDEFDLAAARSAINNGQNLASWIDSVADWVEDPVNSPAPPGTPEYTIVLSTGTGGSGTPSPATVLMDEQAVFTLTADTGYQLDSVTGCGGTLSGDTYTTAPINDVTAGNGDCGVTASFALNQYSVSYSAGTGGTLSGNADQTVAHGSDADAVSAAADTGYSFSQWSDGVGTATRTETNVTGDISAAAEFTLNAYTLTYSAGTDGVISGTSPQTVDHGGDGSTVTAVANTGYTFVQWSDGVATTSRTDTSVTGDINATAQFTINEYTLTYSAGDGGSISGTSPQTVNHGGDGTSVTAVAATGYTFSQWSDGVATATRTDTNVTGAISVTAQFTLNEYTLTYSADTGGSISGTSPQTVNHGDDGNSVSAEADTGYAFDQWSDGVTTATRTDTDVTDDISVTAQFTLNEYTLTYSAGTGGNISGTSPQTVSHGGDGSQVSAIPDSGYAFDQWSDGVTTAGRTDTDVTGDINVSAGFVAAVGAPGGVSADRGDGEATVSWNPVTGADSYNVYYAADSGITPDNYASLPEGTQITGVNSAHTVTGLTNGTVYYFIVTAVQSGVEGSASTTVSAIPALVPWHIKPHEGGLSVDVKGPTQADVSWPTTPGVEYDLYITDDPNTNLDNYAAYGATLELNVTPSFTLSGLPVSQPVYLALKEDGVLSSWTSFTPDVWGVNRTVRAQTVANGVRYVGGEFTAANIITGRGAALPASGAGATHALAFPEVDGSVVASQPDGNGGWYIGGRFSNVGGQERANLAHIDSLGQVTAWNPGVNSTVWALAVDNGIVYAGGQFNAAGGGTATTTRYRLAAFDASGNLLGWNPGANNQVRALVVDNGTIYAGGHFNAAGGGTGTTTRYRLAAFDASGNVLPWDPGANDYVRTLALDDGTVYAGGRFTAAGGGTGITTRNRLAAFDTNGNLLPWDPGVDRNVIALAVDNGTVYVGGDFFNAGGGTGTTPRNNLAAFDTSGNLLAWNPGADGFVYALTVNDGTVYVGGDFTAAGGGGTGSTVRNRMAAFDTSGNLLAWNPSADATVQSLTVNNGTVYAGGNFLATGASTTRNHLAAFDTDGNLLDWNPGADNHVYALTVADGTVYAGGYFTGAGGGAGVTTRNRLAAFDTDGNLLGWNPGADGTVYALTVDNGTVYAGGGFTAAGGGTGTTTRNRLAAFDASGNLLGWNPGAGSNLVLALTVDNGIVYAGGSFLSAGGGTGVTTRRRLAAFDTNGNLLAWDPGANSNVIALAVDNGTIYAGGSFTAAGGGTATTARNRLAAFDDTGDLLAWDPGANSTVRVLTVANGTVYAAGNFSAAGGGTGSTLRYRLAAFDALGNLLEWNPGLNNYAYALTVNNGTAYVGGAFYGAGGDTGTTLRGRMAAFDLNGNLLDQ